MKKAADLKSSFLYRFVIYFVCMIILPILCTWWIYEKVLNYYYAENLVAIRQINMENSLSLLDSSLVAAGNALVALAGNQEIIYYLNYAPNKSNMFYGTYKRAHSFCENLHLMTPYMNSLKIYCDSPLILYADPFVRMKDLGLEEAFLEKLENAGLEETVWRVEIRETEEFPAVYAYRKLYTDNYLKCIGYMELQLSPQLFADYFEMLSGLLGSQETAMGLYQEGRLLYAVSQSEELPVSLEELESGYKIWRGKNRYRNCLQIPELGLEVICCGHLMEENFLPSRNIPSIFLSVLILLLLLLFVTFFMSIFFLSRRILAFSSFIQASNPNSLTPFRPEAKAGKRPDELDVLIDAYNTLIQENDSLISQIEKMELFTQEARFRALQGQIHPHFIYGTLETIRMTALQNRDKEAADMIYSLSSLIRYSISVSSRPVTLRDELEIARHYLMIQKIRFDNRFDYRFQVEEGLLNMELPAFILQPILENAILYGVSQTLDYCTLTVTAREERTETVLTVRNTGKLIARERLEEVNGLLCGSGSSEGIRGNGHGLALNNIKERISIFFDGRASICLKLADGCTVTVITIVKEGTNVSNIDC